VYHVLSLKVRLDDLQAIAGGSPGQADPQAAIALVHGLQADVTALQSDARPVLWLTPYLGWVPRYGGDIQASPHLLTMGSALLDGADTLLNAFSSLLEDAPGDPIQRGLQILSDARPDLQTARARLEAAAEARTQVDAERLSPQMRRWVDRLDRYLPLAEMAVEAGMIAPELVGADEPRTYLILAQNDDEVRPTGGFITGVGLLQVEGGRITEFSFADSYAVDDFSKPYPEPPHPLWDYMLAELWLFRDGNWSPDFPTAARQVAYFYEYGTGQATDGVIALDTQALRLLVEALEPLRIPGTARPITGDNVIDWIRQARSGAPPGEGLADWWKQRKDFIGPLALALRSRLEEGEVDWPTLARAVGQGLQEKHILVYLANPEAAALLSRQGWDGSVSSPAGDYLLVVDSNLGFNKVNPLVDETLEYKVHLGADGAVQGELQISYHNRSQGSATDCDPSSRYGADYIAEVHRCYWDYLRVYVPDGSWLTMATPAPLPEASLYHRKWGGAGRETLTLGLELGKQVFAVYLLVPRGEGREQHFRYVLPQGAVRREGSDWVYALTVQKQPGSRAWPLTVTVVLPEGAQTITSDPAPTEKRGSEIVYRWRLDRDRTLQIRYCFQG
jgi:hypothetical protein